MRSAVLVAKFAIRQNYQNINNINAEQVNSIYQIHGDLRCERCHSAVAVIGTDALC